MNLGIMFPDQSDEELLRQIEQKNGMPGNSMNVCLEELRLRYQRKLIRDTHSLTIATWALTLFTIVLSVVSYCSK